MYFFCPELFGKDASYAVLLRLVGRACQSAQNILVKQVDVNEHTTTEGVILHTFDHILYHTIALEIGFAAEKQLEAMFTNKGAEATGKNQVAKVFLN